MMGEHIRTLKGGRWNHAIDCGDETVIHLAEGVPGGAARVRRSYRPEFVSGAEVVEVVTHRERTFPAKEVVARAYSRIADPALGAMFRDSEAFADWCATGRIPSSPQNAVALQADPAVTGTDAHERSVNARPSRGGGEKSAAKQRGRRTPARKAARKGPARPTSRASAKAKGSGKRGAGKAGKRRVPKRTGIPRARRR